MKKIYTLIAAALACAGTASAQQLPNNMGTFDGTWEDCIPNAIAGETSKVGTEPAGWSGSNVNQMMLFPQLVTQGIDYKDDNENVHSVHLSNHFCGISASMGSTAPAYITIGECWNYGDGTNLNTPKDKSDGGSYGGIDFTFRPDAISLMLKRNLNTENPSEGGTANPNEKATVLVYSWKGQTSSTVTAGLDYKVSIFPISEAKQVTMTNRDKDVLGMITDGVTKSEDFELISKSENYIEGNIDTWTQKVFPIEYLSESTPEKLNIVIACSDYFKRPNLGVNNTLDVDDVALVYYSTLSKLTIGGSEIALTDGTYNYTCTGTMPTSDDEVVATTKSKFAEAKVALDTENNKITITVTNQGGADLDGETSHTYTITYSTAEPKQYSGYLNISLAGIPSPEQQATVEITDNGNGTCTFKLPNFTFSMGGSTLPIGDIVVENVTMTEADGTTTYDGYVEGMQLKGGAIVADVTLKGTITADDVVDFTINVVWNNGGDDVPIDVTFTTESQASTPAEPEQYDGYINAVMNGGQIIENQSATVTITENGDGTCTFLLPNFSFGSAPLGDIKVENVTITEEGETKKYNGEAKGLVLGGEDVGLTITADVTLSGTITGNEVDFKIDVVWTGDGGNRPIDVTFTSGKLSSVEGINAATAAVYGTTGAIAINGYTGMAQVYNMGGTLVASRIVDGDATIDVTAGIYIVRIDGTNVKVIVK